MLPSTLSSIKAAKLISRFTNEARLCFRHEASDYLRLSGFNGTEALKIARRAFIASEAQIGNCPIKTWQQDAKFTKF